MLGSSSLLKFFVFVITLMFKHRPHCVMGI
uniref:Uncharacterized protein n=1 Tax=Rhizophora mucronata TaxID=61149 RepID=A0A2P2IIE1_RHIMU